MLTVSFASMRSPTAYEWPSMSMCLTDEEEEDIFGSGIEEEDEDAEEEEEEAVAGAANYAHTIPQSVL